MLLYLLIYFLAKEHFLLTWRYYVLITAIIFYLVPFAYYKYYIISNVYAAFPRLIEKIHPIPTRLKSLKTSYLIVSTAEGMQFSPGLKRHWLLLLIMGILSLCIIGSQLFQYWNGKRSCLSHSAQILSSKWQNVLKKLKNQLGVKRRVRLYHSEFCKSPMTTEILFPIIFLPFEDEETLNERSCYYIIKHELLHIKHNDFLIQFIGMVVIAVHWFNPLSYILYYELTSTLEMLCDRAVLKGCSEEESKEYRTLLINLATDNSPAKKNSFFVGIAIQKNKIELKRRLLEMKTNQKHRFLLSMATMGLIFAAGGITAFAYIPPNTITSGEGRTDTFDYTYMTDDEKTEEVSLYMPYDYFFIDADGTTIELYDDKLTEKVSCNHHYVTDGTLRAHNKNTDGGCTVKDYEAQICFVCGDIKAGRLIGTYIYPVCPH